VHRLRLAWKWLSFALELVCLLFFTSFAYLVPIPNRQPPTLILCSTFFAAAVLAWSSGNEFRRAGRPAVKDNPPVVLFLLVLLLHMIIAILRFVAP
jgi:hypothetical protein